MTQRITVLDFLQVKYGQEKPQTMTAEDARILGIPYPLTSGWREQYDNKQVTITMLAELMSALSASIREIKGKLALSDNSQKWEYRLSVKELQRGRLYNRFMDY